MSLTGRIAWGHALVGLGLRLRALTVPLALCALAVLVLAAAARSQMGLGPAAILAAPVVVLVGGRLVAVGLGALGWVVFPAHHRTVLSELAARAESNEGPAL